VREKGKYIAFGLTVFSTVGAILLFYDTLFGSRALIAFVKQLLSAVEPVLYGAAMAYLLAPIVDFFDEVGKGRLSKRTGTRGRQVPLAIRALSILLAWTVIGVLLYLLGSVLLPELYKSILQLVSNVETYYNTISGWIQHLLETYPSMEVWVAEQLADYYVLLENWAKNDLLAQATTVMSIVSGGVFGVVGVVSDLFVGIIISVYFLATKETCAAQARKTVYGLFSEEKVYWILRGAHKVDRIFSGFVRGKLLDSLIIGIICFISCTILQFPYAPLVSVIVGVTNVIPFFGPFLGAIPSTFLILLASPIKALYFVIFVLALQQLDGNVIGPKILGDRTGLSSLWVIFAILVGGSFFGLVGMFFAVPVCACIYSAVKFFVETRLQKKNLPLRMEEYTPDGDVGSEPRLPKQQAAETAEES